MPNDIEHPLQTDIIPILSDMLSIFTFNDFFTKESIRLCLQITLYGFI